MNRFALALLLVAPAVHADTLSKAIDAYTAPLLARRELSGQLLVARKGRVVFERSYGSANLELGVPMTPDTRINVASVTKVMTAHLAIQGLEQKKLALGDSIARWFPDFPKGDSITVGMLLQHTSGIPHELVPDSLATEPRTAAEMVEIAKRLPLDFPPGARSSYSSGGFTVLARILELVDGAPYDSLLAREIFRPLGMTRSGGIDGRTITAGRAACYVAGAHGLEIAPFQDLSGLVGAGSVWSTARDLHRFVQGIVTGRLGESTRASYLRNGRLDFNGRTSGFNAFALYDSASGTEMVWAGNVASGAAELLKRALPKLVAGESVPPPVFPALATAAPRAADLARIEGTYRLENGITLHVFQKDGVLWSNDWALQPTVDGDFFSPRDYGRIRGVPGPDGSIARLDWVQNGVRYPAPRVSPPR